MIFFRFFLLSSTLKSFKNILKKHQFNAFFDEKHFKKQFKMQKQTLNIYNI
jgi:hypothetical protein